MKSLKSKTIKSFIKISFLSMFFLIAIQSQVSAQCLSVDLQAVSIDPSLTSISVGQTAQIVVVMKNNGPCPIPTGEAQVQITLSSVYLDLGTPLNFSDICAPARWSYVTTVTNATQHNLFFRNNAGPIPVGGATCAFTFNIKGKAVSPGPSAITLASTMSGTATTSDVDGSNQSAQTEISIIGAPDLTSSQFFSTTQIGAGQVIDEVVVIRNVGNAATSAPIVFNITNYTALTGLTVTSNGSPSVTVGIDTYTLDNANWTFNSVAGTFTSSGAVVIPAGGSRNIGIRITRGTGGSAGANGSVTQTTTIVSGTGGGETPNTNNSISNTLLKF